jgi:hypothetical protein
MRRPKRAMARLETAISKVRALTTTPVAAKVARQNLTSDGESDWVDHG